MARILIVDDSMLARQMHSSFLKELGHETVQACDGLDGLSKVGEGAFDAVFVDLMMPKMDGVSFLKALQERGIKIPALVLSADVQESKRQECLDFGARGFIGKPAKKAKLERALREYLNL